MNENSVLKLWILDHHCPLTLSELWPWHEETQEQCLQSAVSINYWGRGGGGGGGEVGWNGEVNEHPWVNALCPCPGLGNFSKSDTRVNFVCMGDPGLFLLIYYVTLARVGWGGGEGIRPNAPPPIPFFIKRIGVMVGGICQGWGWEDRQHYWEG